MTLDWWNSLYSGYNFRWDKKSRKQLYNRRILDWVDQSVQQTALVRTENAQLSSLSRKQHHVWMTLGHWIGGIVYSGYNSDGIKKTALSYDNIGVGGLVCLENSFGQDRKCLVEHSKQKTAPCLDDTRFLGQSYQKRISY